MNRLRTSVNSVWVAFFIAACAQGQEGSPTGSGGAGTVGTGGNSSVGAGGNSSPGTGGDSSPGAGGSSSPGTGGNSSPGAGGNSSPGTGGNSSGSAGAAGAAAGNTGSGGSQTAGTQGTAGSSPAGTGGSTAAPEPKVVTTTENAFWKVGTLTEVTTGTADVTVNDTSVQQNWNGMGGTFNEVGWNVLSMLTAAERDRAMKLLFDATDGARFQYGRIPIGASDYALERYTLNENAGDTTMSKFSIDRDKQYLIPYIQAALAIKPDVHLWASPWTPPTWMKKNKAMDGGQMDDTDANLQALALYFARFVEEYAKVGITIGAVHPQNEPGYETRYPSCLWNGAGITRLINVMGSTFMSRNLTTEIYLGTMSNNDSGKDGTIVTAVNGDATASKLIKGYGLQWNMLPIVSGLKSRNLNIVQSEHKCGNYPWNPAGFPAFNANTAPNDYPYAIESWGYIRDWIKAGVNVYSAWNMVLDSAGKNSDMMRPWPQNALLTVNTSAKTLTVTPTYYVFRHVSQYVDPGAKVVGTTGGDALAFKNPDGTIVAVIYNSGAAKRMTVTIGGKKQQFDMPAKGWATVNAY